MAALRASETPVQSNVRRNEDAKNRACVCAEETDVETVVRSLVNTLCTRLDRENESDEQKNVKRKKNAENMASVLQNETPSQAVQRRQTHTINQQNCVNRRLSPFYKIARGNDLPMQHCIGEMNISCQYCGALKFPNEDLFKCCHKGKVQLPDLSPYPPELKLLLLGNSKEAKNFKKVYSSI